MGQRTGWKLLKERRAEVLAVAESYQATNVRVFGSVAAGTESANSDIDLLVTCRRPCRRGSNYWR